MILKSFVSLCFFTPQSLPFLTFKDQSKIEKGSRIKQQSLSISGRSMIIEASFFSRSLGLLHLHTKRAVKLGFVQIQHNFINARFRLHFLRGKFAFGLVPSGISASIYLSNWQGN